jgi:VCBS repeat-containing protein
MVPSGQWRKKGASVDALNDGDTLADAITYEAGDGSTTSTATLTITIFGHTD